MGIPTGAAWMRPSEPEGHDEGEAPGVVVSPASPSPWRSTIADAVYDEIGSRPEVTADFLERVLREEELRFAAEENYASSLGATLAVAYAALARLRTLEQTVVTAAQAISEMTDRG